MKNRFTLLTTLVLYLVAAFLGGITMWLLKDRLGLPELISAIIAATILLGYFEFASRIVPEKFDGPFSQFLKLSRRDKVVFLIGVSAFLIIIFTGKSLRSSSGWINLSFVILGFGAFQFICSRFGSRDLRDFTKWGWN